MEAPIQFDLAKTMALTTMQSLMTMQLPPVKKIPMPECAADAIRNSGEESSDFDRCLHRSYYQQSERCCH